MPIYEDEMTQKDMVKAARDHFCAKCNNILTVAWSAERNCYMLRCKDITHTGITRHDISYEKKILGGFSMDSTALTTMTPTDMMKRVEMARFPQDLTKQDKALLAQVAITYGFDPLMGEVTIYQGRPYVSIDGRYRKAQETGQLDGVETRPATKQEREDWQIPEGDYFFRSEVYVKGATRPFVAWGRVHVSETKPGSRKPGDTTSTFKPVQSNPQRMAEKRAEGQALRKAFHIPLPSVEDIGSPDFDVESTAVEVDTTTGEIIEAKEKPTGEIGATEKKQKPKAKTAVAEEKQEASPQPTEAVLHPSGSETSIIDLEWLREALETLQSKGLKAWSNATVVSYLNNIIGQKFTKVSEAVKHLNQEQADDFAAKVQGALDMA